MKAIPLDIASRLVRNRMYWEGPQIDRPNERPYALHRNGYAGMQRYASFLWSGDVYSTWETLKTQIPIALNTALTGIPYWGTDIGGFVPTPEFTAELYVRWFQFGAFCPLVPVSRPSLETSPSMGVEHRRHRPDRNQQLQTAPRFRMPANCTMRTSKPSAGNIWNCATACFRISTARSTSVRRPACRSCAPCGCIFLMIRKQSRAATNICGGISLSRRSLKKERPRVTVYLPTRRLVRLLDAANASKADAKSAAHVDLETMPLYVRAGSILPLGPVKQFTGEKVEQPLSVSIYPGSDASFLLYEDDGISFNYRKGEWMGIQMKWNEAARKLTLQLAPGSRMLPPERRNLTVALAGMKRNVIFEGKSVELSFATGAGEN